MTTAAATWMRGCWQQDGKLPRTPVQREPIGGALADVDNVMTLPVSEEGSVIRSVGEVSLWTVQISERAVMSMIA